MLLMVFVMKNAIIRSLSLLRRDESRCRVARLLTGAMVVLSALLTSTGCNTSNDMGMDHSIPTPFTAANDVQFIDGMVPHHEMATHMADQVLARGASADIRMMAQRMKDAQMREIATMRAARQALVGSPQSPSHDDPHMMSEMTRMMAASGAALDAMFLTEMIPHHASAIEMSHRALPNLRRADMRALAIAIYDDQAREIGEMQRTRQPTP